MQCNQLPQVPCHQTDCTWRTNINTSLGCFCQGSCHSKGKVTTTPSTEAIRYISQLAVPGTMDEEGSRVGGAV